MEVVDVSMLLDEAFIVEAVVPPKKVPIEVDHVTFSSAKVLGTDSAPTSVPHVEMVNIVSLLEEDLQAWLIGTTFGIMNLPMGEPYTLGMKEVEAHAKEAEAHALEVARMEACALEATENGSQASKIIEKGDCVEALGLVSLPA